MRVATPVERAPRLGDVVINAEGFAFLLVYYPGTSGSRDPATYQAINLTSFCIHAKAFSIPDLVAHLKPARILETDTLSTVNTAISAPRPDEQTRPASMVPSPDPPTWEALGFPEGGPTSPTEEPDPDQAGIVLNDLHPHPLEGGS